MDLVVPPQPSSTAADRSAIRLRCLLADSAVGLQCLRRFTTSLAIHRQSVLFAGAQGGDDSDRNASAAVSVRRLLTTTMSSTAWVAVLATVIFLFLQPSNGTIESNRFSGKAPLLDDSSALTMLSRLQRFATWRRPSEPLMQTLCCPSDVR